MAIIALSQQLGSKGTELGRMLAERLQYRFMSGDEVIAETAMRFGVSDDQLLVFDLRTPHFWERLRADSHRYLAFMRSVLLHELTHDRIVAAGRTLAHQVPHVGCGLRVRVVAPFAMRVNQVAADEKIDAHAAEKLVREHDRELHERSHSLSGIDIDDVTQYDAVINSAGHPAEIIIASLAETARRIDELAGPTCRQQLRDLAIEAQIRAALLAHPKVLDAQIGIQCKSGVVKLNGTGLVAPWDAMVTEVARKIEGVITVEITAEEAPMLLSE